MTNHDERAFPFNRFHDSVQGMSLWDYFAAHAPYRFGVGDAFNGPDERAKVVAGYADSMMAERERRKARGVMGDPLAEAVHQIYGAPMTDEKLDARVERVVERLRKEAGPALNWTAHQAADLIRELHIALNIPGPRLELVNLRADYAALSRERDALLELVDELIATFDQGSDEVSDDIEDLVGRARSLRSAQGESHGK